MEQIGKEVIKSEWGFLKDSIIGSAVYLEGLPDVRPGDVVGLMIYDEGIIFSISSFLKKTRYFGIKKSELEAVEFESWESLKEKERSVIGRAIVGGILFGPLGAIIGGISGVKNKKIMPDYALVFASKSGDKVIFNVKAKNVDKISKTLRKNLSLFLV